MKNLRPTRDGPNQVRCTTESPAFTWPIYRVALVLLLLVAFPIGGPGVYADGGEPTEAYPDKFQLAVGYMRLSDIVTDITLNNSRTGGIGTRIEYSRDLGGDSSADIARLQGYYRFNDRHRLDFSAGSVGRTGDRVLGVEIAFGEEVFEVNERVVSSIDTAIYQLAYTYSFYHTPKVELSGTGGLYIMDYAVEVRSTRDGDGSEGDVTAPLPVWGLRTSYAITPRWQTNFGFETFYININDKYRGSLMEVELSTEYRLFRNVGVGFGLSRLGLDLKADTSGYRGRITEIYRGVEVFFSVRF